MPLTWDNKQKGRGNYYLRGTIRGEQIYETTGTDDPKAAEAICIKRAEELLQSSIFGAKSVAKFSDAALRYLDQGGEVRFVGRYDEDTGKYDGLLGYFGDKMLMSLGQSELDAAARSLYPHASPETRNRQVYTPFIAVWNAGTPDLCDKRDWHRPKMSAPSRKRWCQVEEVEKLLESSAPHIRRLLAFLVFTGCRPIEAFKLNWSDVNFEKSWVVFRETKNGQDRGVALHPCAIEALSAIKGKREGRVFRTHRGEPYADRDEGAGQIKTAWAASCRRAGFAQIDPKTAKARKKRILWDGEPLVPYSLRHTCATWLLIAGVQEQIKDEIMGHASSSMGRRYAHVPRPEITAGILRLPCVKCVYADIEKRTND